MGRGVARVVLLAIPLLAACGTDVHPVVASRAAFDMDCPEQQIEVSDGAGSCTFYARGCGKKAAYVVRAKSADSMVCCPPIGCDAMLNGPVMSISSTTPPAPDGG